MADEQERWECPACGAALNIASLGIYAKVACPACGHVDHVHTTLANFRIEGVLGLGGMSVVLRARDLVLERPLAIKLLNEFYRDQPERIARFEQECELMAKVRHENVVSVYSAGRVKGQFYIAMELVNGRNLEELVHEQGPMEPAEALRVLRQVVHGLDAAHKAGLLHRDMKPGNIIICEDGQAKVLDFGLSLGKRDEDTEEIIWATPYYVPPETLMREPEDTRTDIYALGMTLRHLLTGQENFEPAPEGIEDMLECKRHLPRMAEQMPSLPEAYCELIDHMTGYDPVSRPAGYKALLTEIDEVRALLDSERVGFGTRLRRLQPLMAGVAGTLALGSAAAALVSMLAAPEPEQLYITPAPTLEWRECEALAAAMAHLEAERFDEAKLAMQQLADSEGEPTICARAALHALIFSYLQEDVQAREAEYNHFKERFSYHLSRTPAPAGQECHALMAELPKAGNDTRLSDKVMQIVLSLSRIRTAAQDFDDKLVARRLQDARLAFGGAGPAYTRLAERLPQANTFITGDRAAYERQRCARLVAELRVDEAARLLGEMERRAPQGTKAAHFAVQKEALDLFREAVAMMERCKLRPASPEELTTVRLQEILASLDEPTLAAEITTLMLMAQGEFADAAAFNPHEDSPKSREPFAVLMRDWMERVK